MTKQQLNNKILNLLPVSDMQKLLPLMEKVQLEKDQYVYQPDDLINYIYFPIDAVITEYQILHSGKTIELSLIGWEGIVGGRSVFNSEVSHNWFQVLIPVVLCELTQQISNGNSKNQENLQIYYFLILIYTYFIFRGK